MLQDSKYNLFHIDDVSYIHIKIYRYSTIDPNYIFFYQIYIYIRMIMVAEKDKNYVDLQNYTKNNVIYTKIILHTQK